MIKREELTDFIYERLGEDWMQKGLTKDEVANGVQVVGSEEVEKVALGVSVNEEFLSEAAKWGANYCIFHHGLDTRTYKSRYPMHSQKRLRLVFENNMTVAGFHYTLDAHPELGNNAVIIRELGAKIKEPLFEEWGYTAEFPKAKDVHDLAHEANKLFDHEVFAVLNGPHKVKTIGVVSGAAKPFAQIYGEFEDKGVELFISGETSESVPHAMKENEINYFACGHYATEVFGVKALGKEIEKEFGKKVEVKFIDIENPV